MNDRTHPTFFRRHDRLLTVVGALIVFLTFLFKEGLVEHFKEFDESVDNAETTFLLNNGNLALLDRMEGIDFKLDSLQTPLQPVVATPADGGSGSSPQDVQRTEENIEVRIYYMEQAIQLAVDRLGRLIEKLPPRECIPARPGTQTWW